MHKRCRASAPAVESDARHAGAHTFDFWAIAPTDDPDHKLAGYTRFKRSFGGQVNEHAGTWDLPIHAVKYSLYRAAETFSNTYILVGRSSHY
jgi:lipid II:glycine glycyltransferase (peptidoglycan interpeptide bridge formation enzyme)